MLQSNYVQDQILLHTLGQAVKGINIAEVRRLTLAIPPLPEQEEIAKYLGQITKSLRDLKAELDKLRLQKQGLMQDLLTGKVCVTEPLKQQPAN